MRMEINRKKVKRFTDGLYSLLVLQKLELPKALKILNRNWINRKKDNSGCREIEELIHSLEKGNSFSEALEINKGIHFDDTYSFFIQFAEKSGNLGDSISYLKNRCERKEETINKLIEAIIYPVFVVLLAVCCIIFLGFYSSSLGSNEIITGQGMFSFESMGKGFIFLLFYSLGGAWFIRRNLGEDKLYEAFLAAAFLVKNGESFGSAIETARNILGQDSAEGKIFEGAQEKLEYGFELKNAFNFENNRKSEVLEEAFFFAENTGGEEEIFEKVAEKLRLDGDRRRKICLKLIEPMFIAGTGIFLLIFLMNTVLPLLSGSIF